MGSALLKGWIAKGIGPVEIVETEAVARAQGAREIGARKARTANCADVEPARLPSSR